PLLLPHETPLLQIHLSNIHLQPPPTTTLFPYTTLFRSMKNEPGALYQLLEPFHRQGVDLTRVETRPSPSGTWAYVFYIDFEGHIDRKSTRLNSSHVSISYAVFCLKKKKLTMRPTSRLLS